MKKLFLKSLVLFSAFFAFTSTGNSTVIEYNLTNTFSDSAPSGWVNLKFDDSGSTDSVTMTLTSHLDTTEFTQSGLANDESGWNSPGKAPIPEPGVTFLFSLGVVGFAGIARKKITNQGVYFSLGRGV